MKTKFVQFFGLLLLLLFAFSAPSFAMTADYITVNEYWNGESVVNFSVDTSYDDIIGFAVGTNFSFNFGATVDFDTSDPAPVSWSGVAAVKVGGTTWRQVVYNNTAPPAFDALPDFINLDIDAFDGYSSAFVFYGTGDPVTALETGFTNGFSGYAFNQDSVFAAFRADGTFFTGDTSIVPIPGAAILLFSGMIGLVGIRRKK